MSNSALREDEETIVDTSPLKASHKTKVRSLEMKVVDGGSRIKSGHGSNASNSISHSANNSTSRPLLQLSTGHSLKQRSSTPRSKAKRRRYVHTRDVSVGSQIPSSIKSYTPALIALIDHTKGLQTNSKNFGLLKRAISAYPNNNNNSNNHRNGLDLDKMERPSTAKSLRDVRDVNKQITFTNSQDEKDSAQLGPVVPKLMSTDSNPSVVKHNKQDSGTFLVNEISQDGAYEPNINEDSAYHVEPESGVFMASPKTPIKSGHRTRSSMSRSATTDNNGTQFEFGGPTKSAPPIQMSTVPSGTQLIPNDTTDSIPDIENLSKIAMTSKQISGSPPVGPSDAIIAGMTEADVRKLIELSQNAGQEYLYLVQINEDLMKERQMLLLRLEDMQTNMQDLKKSLLDDKKHRRQQSDLGTQMETYKSQMIALTTENEMLQETVNDLEAHLKETKNEVQKEQAKQVKIMEAIARGESVDLSTFNVDDMDLTDANIGDAKSKSLLEQALTQLESARQERSEFEKLYNDTKKELMQMKKERNENAKRVEGLSQLVETQQFELNKQKSMAQRHFDDLNTELEATNAMVLAQEELAKRMEELQETNNMLSNDQMRLETELEDVKRMYQHQLQQHLGDVDYTKVAMDDEMLMTVGQHMRQLSAMHTRNISGMSFTTENLGDYYYTLGSGFQGTDMAQFSARAMGAQQFDDQYEFSQTRNTTNIVNNEEENDTKDAKDAKDGKVLKVSVVDEAGQTKNQMGAEQRENGEMSPVEDKDKDGKDAKEKEEKRKEAERKKRLAAKLKEQEIQKARAEMEFFFLTCMAVKMNLKEAFPDTDQLDEELIAENPWELFKIAQEEKVPMNKFALWTENYLREKYNLGKMRFAGRIKLGLANLNVKDNIGKAKSFAKEQGKKVGEATSEMASQVGQRVRKMTLDAADKYQKFRTSRSSRTSKTSKTTNDKEKAMNNKQKSESSPVSPKDYNNNVLEYSTDTGALSGNEANDEKDGQYGQYGQDARETTPQIAEETKSQLKLHGVDSDESLVDKDGKDSKDNKDGKTDTKGDTNNNAQATSPMDRMKEKMTCCTIM